MDVVLECPHCKMYFIINENDLNCRIIRHAVFKNTMTQINPHSSKKICDELVKNDKVIGCAKPSKIIKNENSSTYMAVECDYI